MLLLALAMGLLASGCTSGPTIKKTFMDKVSTEVPFKNVLIAADTVVYENRANFERVLATRLRAAGVSATALYKIGGGNRPVDRDALLAAVEKGGFDAVLFTHPLTSITQVAKKQGFTQVDSNRKSDSAINLFRYDYEENTLPDYESLAASAVLITALYSVATEKKIWEARTDLVERDNVSLLIDDAVTLLLAEIRRDKLLQAR